MHLSGPVIVAIPVRNEEARIGACLAALAAQSRPCDEILLLLNNCTDGTMAICRAARATGMKIRIAECWLPAERASAGEARRLALNQAAARAGAGFVLTTDADAVPGAEWVFENLRAMLAGADVVCGQAVIDPGEQDSLPLALRSDGLREEFLLLLLDEIAALVDPDPADPWPRHQHDSGASIGLRAEALRRAGGAPRVAFGEDRALVARLRLMDARIRHAPGIKVYVSGRVQGRAAGGMAATLRRRMALRDEWMDDRVEPAVHAYRRAISKARLRDAMVRPALAAVLADDLLIGQRVMRRVMRARHFGAAWAEVQRLSPMLRRRRVAFIDLARETRQALALRDELLRDAAGATARGARVTGREIAG